MTDLNQGLKQVLDMGQERSARIVDTLAKISTLDVERCEMAADVAALADPHDRSPELDQLCEIMREVRDFYEKLILARAEAGTLTDKWFDIPEKIRERRAKGRELDHLRVEAIKELTQNMEPKNVN